MLSVSNAFNTAILGRERVTDAIVEVRFTSASTGFGTPTTGTALPGYPASQLTNGRIRENIKAYTGLSSDIPVAIQSASTGWKGTYTSNSVGTLNGTETINITYSPGRTVSALWIVGNVINYPVNFTISINSGTPVAVTGNTLPIYVYKFDSVEVTSVDIAITKISYPNTNTHIMECGLISTLYLDARDIIEMGGLEEFNSDSTTLIGTVSANDAFVKIINISNLFTMTGSRSPFIDSVNTNIVFKPFVGVLVSTDTIELVPMGTFITNGWPSATETDVTLEGMDRISTLSQTAFPYLKPSNNPSVLTLQSYVETVLTYLGEDYEYLSTKNRELYLAYTTRSNMRDWLQDVVSALPGYAYISRDNKLRIIDLPFEDNVILRPVQQEWSDSDLIVQGVNPHKFGEVLTTLVVNIISTSPIATVDVAEVSRFLSKDVNVMEVNFSQPIYYIEAVELRKGTILQLASFEYNAMKGKFTINRV